MYSVTYIEYFFPLRTPPSQNHPCIPFPWYLDLIDFLFGVFPSPFLSPFPEFTQAYADVVFLADTSQNTSQASFQWMRNFISKVVKMLDVGRNKYQIGLAQYGGQGHTEFLLNTYQSQDEVTTHIHEHFVVRGGSRRTGKALRYLHQTFFQEAAGSRFLQGVPQYAVVITSGKSEDEVWDAAQTLREKGVKVISVGVQDFDRRELEGMGTPPLVYEMQSQDGVRQVIQDVNMVIQGIGRSEVRTEAEEDTTVTEAEKDTTVGKVWSLGMWATGKSQHNRKVWGKGQRWGILWIPQHRETGTDRWDRGEGLEQH